MEEEEAGITLADAVKILKEYFVQFKQNKWSVLLIICVASAVGFMIAYRSKPKYVASCSMMLESSSSGRMSGALALANQFGLLGGGGGGGAVINEEKLIEIVSLESIIKTALFQKVTIDSVNDVLANHFIRLFDYTKQWKKNGELKDFRFQNSKESLTEKENRILKMFYGRIKGEFLKTDKSKSGIISIVVTTPNEVFSKCFNDELIKAVTSFYVDRIAEKGRKNVDIIQKRVDSVAEALRDSEMTLAKWKDGSHQLVKAQGMMNEIRLRRNVEVNNSMYIEGVKQLEIAKFSLLNETPFLQVLDEPSLPLAAKGKISFVKGVLVGGFVGVLLAFLYLWMKKVYIETILPVIRAENSP